MIRNLVFDMGNVLIHYIPQVFMDRLGVPAEDQPLLAREVFGSVEWIRMDRGTLGQEEAVAAMEARLPRRLWEYARRLVLGWWLDGPLMPVEGMAALLEELKGLGYGLYLLSNATVRQPEYFPGIPGSQFFDGAVISAHWKVLKPEREIYEILFREYGLEPSECFFVDDLNINVEGALCAGMDGYIFDGDVGRLRQALCRAGVPVKTGED
ncbi:MAG: HAD family phosphatase [Oscillospiraceae bacterium]|jgi:putative hydrolase of the HAD superfamily|nr:HAD family phosphatase [Oscillospiraceae bacterium]